MGSAKPPAPPTIINQSATPPVAPNVNETREQALQAELKYRPQFREQDVQDIMRLGQAAADVERQQAFPLAREEQALYRTLEPGTFAVQEGTAKAIADRLGNPLTPELQDAYLQQFRSEEALGGRLGSPVGSVNVARDLASTIENSRLQAISAGLSYLNRTPLGVPNVPIQRGVTGDVSSLVAPSLGAASSIYGTSGDVFGRQLGAAASAYGARLNYMGNIKQAQYGLIQKAIPNINIGLGGGGAPIPS